MDLLAVCGIGDMARALGIPIVGGNVSFYNESDEFKTAIPPTPSIGMVGISEDCHAPGMGFADTGDAIILVGGREWNSAGASTTGSTAAQAESFLCPQAVRRRSSIL